MLGVWHVPVTKEYRRLMQKDCQAFHFAHEFLISLGNLVRGYPKIYKGEERGEQGGR